MAPNACKVLCLVLLFAFITQGYGNCDLTSLTVTQTKTGRLIQNKPEWQATVANPCNCKFQYVKLSCAGFQSVTPVATALLSKYEDTCLFYAGRIIYPHIKIVFSYVWDITFDFKAIDGIILCP